MTLIIHIVKNQKNDLLISGTYFYYLVFLKWGLQQGQNSIILPEISEVGNPKKFLSRGFEEG